MPISTSANPPATLPQLLMRTVCAATAEEDRVVVVVDRTVLLEEVVELPDPPIMVKYQVPETVSV